MFSTCCKSRERNVFLPCPTSNRRRMSLASKPELDGVQAKCLLVDAVILLKK